MKGVAIQDTSTGCHYYTPNRKAEGALHLLAGILVEEREEPVGAQDDSPDQTRVSIVTLHDKFQEFDSRTPE